jgi:hypothetical protein
VQLNKFLRSLLCGTVDVKAASVVLMVYRRCSREHLRHASNVIILDDNTEESEDLKPIGVIVPLSREDTVFRRRSGKRITQRGRFRQRFHT